MASRIIVDGIKVEGAEAQRIIDEVMRDVDDAGTARRLVPLSLLVTVAVACGIAAGLTGYLLGRAAPGVPTGWRVAICIVVSICVCGACSRVHWRFYRRKLRAAMQRRGFDLCSTCGYWLKGLGERQGRCPECGASRPVGRPEAGVRG
ncbi:MAG: hypothetical protein HKO59_11610 [Phycisphaerales bacterium]|nr:hypothetical protein [Phycisphaerae bacterium]NNF41438.1 hypothetical protein [Phycisphaerales bacterium]NNM26609.1 hypothetical protein [Phycisphaerales bacterium]